MPALLLIVVSLLVLGLMFSQVGSAGDQAIQTQSVADSGAVAGAHVLRDAGISRTVHLGLPTTFPSFGAQFATAVPQLTTAGMTATVCDATSRNWDSNPHRSELGCGDVQIAADTGEVTVHVTSPSGEVADGPADVQSVRSKTRASAEVVLARCPKPAAATPEGTAMAHWIAQTAANTFGTSAPPCLTPEDKQVLTRLALLPEAAQLAKIGPAVPILDAVTHGFRVEIVD